MSRPRPAAAPPSAPPDDRDLVAASRRVAGRAAAAIALALVGIPAGGGLGGCSGVASKSSPQRIEILPGLGPDACRPERFAAAWEDADAGDEAVPGADASPR